MSFIRGVEEEIAKKYDEGKMRCPTHLSIGQESVPSVFSMFVKEKDFCVSTHRGHAHYLAKGGNLNAMIAEIYGKKTGCSSGKGGSMHVCDPRVNFMGTSAIVGNSIPVGVGLALSSSLKNTNQISCIFLGDGAVEEGVFYESVNFAAVRKLPVLFICENNLYSVYSDLSVRQPLGRKISDMVKSIGIESLAGEGSDLSQVYKNFNKAFNYIRSGKGPFFLEFSTYRWLEHCGHNFDNNIGYRSLSEFKKWQKKDPLNNLEKYLKDSKTNNDNFINKENTFNKKRIQNAFKFAEKSDFPKSTDAFKGVYA